MSYDNPTLLESLEYLVKYEMYNEKPKFWVSFGNGPDRAIEKGDYYRKGRDGKPRLMTWGGKLLEQVNKDRVKMDYRIVRPYVLCNGRVWTGVAVMDNGYGPMGVYDCTGGSGGCRLVEPGDRSGHGGDLRDLTRVFGKLKREYWPDHAREGAQIPMSELNEKVALLSKKYTDAAWSEAKSLDWTRSSNAYQSSIRR